MDKLPELARSSYRAPDEQSSRGTGAFEALLAASRVGVWIHHLGHIEFVNDVLCEILGYTEPAQLIGRDMYEVIAEENHRRVQQRTSSILSSGKPAPLTEFRLICCDDSEVDVEVASAPVQDGPKGRILATFRPISGRKRMQLELARSEASCRSLIKNASDGILVSGANGQFVEVNDAVCRMLRYERDDLIGRRITDLIDPEDLARTPASCEALKNTGALLRERKLRRRDDSCMHAEISASRLPDGSVLALVRDISQRKEAEAAVLARDVAERANQAKSEFLSRASHELRTPLNAILGLSQFMLLDTTNSLSTTQKRHLGHIENAGRHLLALVNDLLDLSQIENGILPIAFRQIDLADVIEETLCSLQAVAAGRDVELRWEGAPSGQLRLCTDPTRIRQILDNLVSNGIKYSPEAGRVVVRARLRESEIEVSVSDNGLGMTTEQMGALFQPFNRLGREVLGVEGTGIGLVVTRQLVELLSGTIDVRSQPGKGTEVVVTLPVAGSTS